MAIRDLIPNFGRKREDVPVRRNGRDPFLDLQNEMNHLFDDFFADFSLSPRWHERGVAAAAFTPRVDVSENDKEVKISAELPGIDEKDISVEMDDSAVSIRGEKREEKEDSGHSWHCREQSYGSFYRLIPLAGTVDGTKAKAKFKNGVLTVSVPKREDEKAKRKAIDIERE